MRSDAALSGLGGVLHKQPADIRQALALDGLLSEGTCDGESTVGTVFRVKPNRQDASPCVSDIGVALSQNTDQQ